jgi:microsomal epoxide hydrolase
MEVPGAAWTRLRLSLGRSLASGEVWDASCTYGAAPDALGRLAEHWYDGFELPPSLLELPRFETRLGSEHVSFVHARAAGPPGVPLLLLHGYGASVAEFSQVIEPLTEAGLHVICPELPVASSPELLATLMRRLGYDRYAVHGSDLGACIALELAALCPERVVGLHVTCLPSYPPEDVALTPSEKVKLARLCELREELAYQLPTTPLEALAFALARADDEPAAETLLAGLTVAWTIGSNHDELYRAIRLAAAPPSETPVIVHDFPLGTPSLSRFARLSHRVVDWHEHDTGGASPAMERPAWLIESLAAWGEALS